MLESVRKLFEIIKELIDNKFYGKSAFFILWALQKGRKL